MAMKARLVCGEEEDDPALIGGTRRAERQRKKRRKGCGGDGLRRWDVSALRAGWCWAGPGRAGSAGRLRPFIFFLLKNISLFSKQQNKHKF